MPASHFWWLLRAWRTSWIWRKVGRGVSLLRARTKLLKDLDSLRWWAKCNKMKQSRKKKVCVLVRIPNQKAQNDRDSLERQLFPKTSRLQSEWCVSQSCKTFDLKLNAILGIVEKNILSRMLGMIALICSNRVTPLPPIQGSGQLVHLRKPIHAPLWMSYVTYVREKVWCWER